MAPRVIAGILCLYILLLSGNPLSAGFLLFQTALSDSQNLETYGENRMKEQLEKLFNHNSLSFTETQNAFSEIFEGKVDPVVLGSFLTALKMNGYSADEIGGAATAMIGAAEPFTRDTSVDVGEIVGTGGDKLKTINISTISGIICATLGLHVAKHGNTAVSSKTGASDVLTQLGYNVRTSKEDTRKALEDEGFAFSLHRYITRVCVLQPLFVKL